MTTTTAWKRDLAIERGIIVKHIEQTLKEADGVIVESSIAHIRSMLDESKRLYLDGNAIASMWAGQAALEATAHVTSALSDFKLYQAKWKVVAGGKKGAHRRKQDKSGKEKRPRIAAAIAAYKGKPHKMASTLAKQFKCSATYIRQIKNETAIP